MTHTTKLSFFALLFTIISMDACRKDWRWVKGHGDNITQTRSISAFSSITLEIDANVEYTANSTPALEINAQQNIADIIETVIQGSRLTIRYKDHVHTRSHNTITIKVSAQDLADISIDGSGNVSTNSILNSDHLSASVSGSGDINIGGITAGSADLHISGSGNININSGTAGSETIKISGSGDVNTPELVAQTVSVNISGSGDGRVQATATLDVTISGSGDVWYKGNPAVNSHISGSGSVKRL